MPELPEVETVVRGLRESLPGHEILGVEVFWPRSVRDLDPEAFACRLEGQRVVDVGRRGKWIVISLSEGHTLLIHLRMTGQLVWEPEDSPDEKYTRVLFHFDDAWRLRFSDMRKFGRIVLTDSSDEVLGDLGPEPLSDDFTVARFEEMLSERRGRIKSLLLNQRFLVGLGNIYVNEALWRAGIHPRRSANDLSCSDVRELHGAIRSVLREAIASNGTTLADGGYQRADGSSGEFAHQLAVYGREDAPCPRCGETIERIEVGQRGTFVCRRCQALLQGGE
jgi:formamidopyrimidine-DNA glycosylase